MSELFPYTKQKWKKLSESWREVRQHYAKRELLWLLVKDLFVWNTRKD